MSVLDGEYLIAIAEMLLPDNVKAQCRFSFRADLTATATNAQIEDAVESYFDDFFGDYVTYISDDISFNPGAISTMEFDEELGQWLVAQVIGEATPDVSPTNTDGIFPNAVAGTVTAKTVRPKSNGRKALPGLVGTAAVDNNLVAGALADLVDVATDYIDPEAVGAIGELVPGILRVGVNQFRAFTSGAANEILGSMRTRKPGVGD
jgi:hypothetical protein